KTLPLNFLSSGFGWMRGLQNRDGGIPTFCKGWGKLPFDRSGTDLTAHVVRAIRFWPLEENRTVLLPMEEAADPNPSAREMLWYLKAHQRPDGSWLPLWFGNQDHH